MGTELPGHEKPVRLAQSLRLLLQRRRLRDRFFDADLFAEPAWEMVLALMQARLEGRVGTIDSLSAAASIPTATVLELLDTLEKWNISIRRPNPVHPLQLDVHLTDIAADSLADYLAALSAMN